VWKWDEESMMKFASTLGRDLPASLVVFMVALPLCIAIAQACGAPAEAGILTGVIGGTVVGLVAGSPLQVSGPAAGLIVLVYDIRAELGVAAMGAAIALAGLFQIVAGAIKLGNWFRAVSPAVVHGMLAGIGIVVFASQVHVLVDDVPSGKPVDNLLSIPRAILKAFNDQDVEYPHHRSAAVVGLLAIAVLIGWNAYKPRRLKVVPGALIAVVVGAFVAWLMPQDIRTVAVKANILAAVQEIDQIDRALWLNPAVWQAAATIALIASAETLLCATAVDRMHTGPRTNYNRELAAQGIGNLICGCLGILPMTGVIVRSAANVDAGAKTRLSSILHGAWLLIFVTALPGVLELAPTTSLAAILIVTGYRLVDPAGIRELWKTSKTEAAILVVTTFTIVATDLLTGVLTGVALAILKLVWTFSHLKIRTESDALGLRTTLRLEGAATFLRLPWLADALERVPPNTELHVDIEHLTYIDHACLELLMTWEKQHEATGGGLVLDWDSLHGRFKSPRTPVAPADVRPSLRRDASPAATCE
jgi:MFS superfamily sulfate permease-like transporter